MNVYAVIILVALSFEYGLSILSDRLNLKALQPELPAEFADVYDAERYRRSQEYTRARTRFSLIPSTFDLALLFAFWGLGGFAWWNTTVLAWGSGPLVTGLVFIGGLGLANSLVHLPFAWYSTFVIEERFGFNKTTPATFWADRLKGLLLTLVIGTPLLALVLWFFQATGTGAWLWCWIAVTAITIVLQFVAPTWIFPLFNRFETLDEGELRDAMLAYAAKVSFPLEGLFVIDGSRRSTKANAFFTGFGKRKRVALFDTLIERHSVEELVAVVAHEVGHFKRGHIIKSMLLGILQTGVLFFLLSRFLNEPKLFAAFGIGETSVYAGLIFFSLLYSPINLVLSFFMQAFSRKNEFEADAFARETTGSSEALIAGLKKLSADSLSNLTPHPLHVRLNYSHPPLLERIHALRNPG